MLAQLQIDLDYIVIGLAALVLVLIIIVITNIVQMSKLKKRYKIFMSGKDAKSLEDILTKRLNQVDTLIEANAKNEKDISKIFTTLRNTYEKMGLINAMHSREGCYTYIKEIVDGNSIIALADEEKEALEMAKNSVIAK